MAGSKPKGKSGIDRAKPGLVGWKQGFNGTENSVERRILTGDWRLPGKSAEETKAAYRKWQKQVLHDSTSMERWYHDEVKETDPRGENS